MTEPYKGKYPCRNHPNVVGWVGQGRVISREYYGPKDTKGQDVSEYYLCKQCYEERDKK